jgi:hypothetical protein
MQQQQSRWRVAKMTAAFDQAAARAAGIENHHIPPGDTTMAQRTTMTTTLATLSPRLPAQTREAAALVVDWLDHGLITPTEACANIATLRQHDAAMADVLTQVVSAWSAAALAHTRRMMARGL